MDMLLPRLIKKYRQKQGIGVRKFSKNCGVSPATVSRVERGKNFDISTFAKIMPTVDPMGLYIDEILAEYAGKRKDWP